jgi:hypothetical protein
MGSFPHELPGYRHVSGDGARQLFESLWGVPLDSEPGLRIPNMLDAAVDGTSRGSTSRARTSCSPTRTPSTSRRAGGDGMRRRAGPVPERDRQLRPRLPAGLDLPGEGRHLHQCRAPHPARAQGDAAEERQGGLGDDARSSPRPWASLELRPSVRDHGRDRRADAEFFRRLLCQARRRVRCSGPATRRRRWARRSCISMASCAARASSWSPNMSRPTSAPARASRCC